jgi:hypothetical protein
MEYKNKFIDNMNEFEKLKNLINTIFISNSSLPNQVFHKEYTNYLFKEFDFTMTDEFWSEIRELANKTNDDFIIMAVLNPDPITYYFKEFGYFNWVKLEVSITPDQYLDILNFSPEDSPADSIFVNSYTVVWVSPSMNWGIWAEREKEICVIAFSEKMYMDSLNPILNNWRPIDNEITDWIGLNYKNFTIPKDVKDKLFLNYKSGC